MVQYQRSTRYGLKKSLLRYTIVLNGWRNKDYLVEGEFMKKSIADVISFLVIIFSMLYLKDKYHLNFWTYLVISVQE